MWRKAVTVCFRRCKRISKEREGEREEGGEERKSKLNNTVTILLLYRRDIITCTELEAALHVLKETSGEAKVRSLISVLDEDHDGNINLQEVAAVRPYSLSAPLLLCMSRCSHTALLCWGVASGSCCV